MVPQDDDSEVVLGGTSPTSRAESPSECGISDIDHVARREIRSQSVSEDEVVMRWDDGGPVTRSRPGAKHELTPGFDSSELTKGDGRRVRRQSRRSGRRTRAAGPGFDGTLPGVDGGMGFTLRCFFSFSFS